MDLNKLEERLNKIEATHKKYFKKYLEIAKAMIKNLILYGFLAWVFINIYKMYGFEITLIILGIGIFYIHWEKGLK